MIDRTVQPPVCEPEDFVLQHPECRVLPNGIPLNVLNIGDNEVVRVDILMKGGRWHQRLPLQALFTNRMLREGTARYPAGEIAERLDYYGAWLELSSAAEYAFITLYSLNKYLPQTLDVLESMVKEPLFPEQELRTIIDNNVQQFKVNSSKVDFLAQRGLVEAIFGGNHPCGRVVQETDYENITSGVLREFYETYYHSGNCSIYLSGKVTQECLRRVEALFGREPFGRNFTQVSHKHFLPEATKRKRIFIERSDAMQSAVKMGMVTIDRNHPDYQKLRVLVTLLGGYFGSRLMSNIREEKGYTYGISAGLVSYPDVSSFIISTETANEYVEPLIGEVYREIERLQNEPVPEEELAMVRNYMLGDLCRSYESAFSLADAWIFLYTSGLSASFFDEALHAVKTITPQDIRRLAGDYLCKENLKEVISGKKNIETILS